MSKRNDTLQELCRNYLRRLKYIAGKHGLKSWVNDIIKENSNGECRATQHEVEMLSRLCNDDRLTRQEVPKLLNKSYRQSYEDGDFDKIRRFGHVGIYSKVGTLLLKTKKCDKK